MYIPTGEFLNTVISHSLMPTIYYPTRITDTFATLIDNIFVHSLHHKLDTAIVYNDILDHLPVVMHCSTLLFKNSARSETKWLYNEKSIESFQVALGNID